MTKLTFSQVKLADLKQVVNLQKGKIGNYQWNQVDSINLTPTEQQRLDFLKLELWECDTHWVHPNASKNPKIKRFLVMGNR